MTHQDGVVQGRHAVLVDSRDVSAVLYQSLQELLELGLRPQLLVAHQIDEAIGSLQLEKNGEEERGGGGEGGRGRRGGGGEGGGFV